MSVSAFMDEQRNEQLSHTHRLIPEHAHGDRAGNYTGLTTRMAWRTAAVLYATTAAACLAQVAFGLFGGVVRDTDTLTAVAVIALALSALWLHLGRREADARWLHCGQLISYVLLAVVLGQAPAVEGHVGIAYLLPLTFASLYMPARALGFYLAVSIAFIAFTSAHATGGFALVPALMIAAAMVATASLTLYVRLQLDRIGRQAAFLSGRDALTGLANLRSLYERVELMIRRAAREECGLTVLMLDLQGFKQVNDQHSHSAGDETLRAVAEALGECVRRDELVARRGGDEFAIVSSVSDEEDVEALIERTTAAVTRARERLMPELPSGVTVGWSTYHDGDTVGRLMARADHALNEAKSAARVNRWSARARRLGREFEPGSGS